MRAMSDPSPVIVATDPATLRTIADEAFTAFNSGGRHVQSFSARYPGFTLDDAYRVTALANKLRVANGYKPVGRKAGFTNRQMWKEYGVSAPNWGYVYDRTLHDLAVPLPLAPYTEPKIEPEIMSASPLRPCPAWTMPRCCHASDGSRTAGSSFNRSSPAGNFPCPTTRPAKPCTAPCW